MSTGVIEGVRSMQIDMTSFFSSLSYKRYFNEVEFSYTCFKRSITKRVWSIFAHCIHAVLYVYPSILTSFWYRYSLHAIYPACPSLKCLAFTVCRHIYNFGFASIGAVASWFMVTFPFFWALPKKITSTVRSSLSHISIQVKFNLFLRFRPEHTGIS